MLENNNYTEDKEELDNNELSGSCTSTEEEEEMIVYVKFENQSDDYSLQDVDNHKFIGIETDEPILSLGNKTFSGCWKHLPTTALFFEEGPIKKLGHESKHTINYIDKTRKVLHMTRIFITPKIQNKTLNASTITTNDSNNEEEM